MSEVHVINRTVTRFLLWFGLVAIVFVLGLQTVIRRSSNNIRHRKDSYVPEVVYLVYVSTLLFYIADNYAWPSCGSCMFSIIGGAVVYISSRSITYVFFLQRAKISQAIAPVLGPRWFKHIFPCAIFITWVGFCIAIVAVSSDMRVECLRYSGIPYCQSTILRNDGRTMAVSIAGALLEMAFATSMYSALIRCCCFNHHLRRYRHALPVHQAIYCD